MLRAAVVASCLCLLIGCGGETEETDPRAAYAAQYKGKVLDNLMMADVNGAPQAMVGEDYDPTKPVILNLWATWCTPCVKEMPSLYALQRSGKAYVVAVSTDRMDERIRQFLSEHDLKDLNVRWDKGSKVLREADLAVPALPVTFILRRNEAGKFVVQGAELGEREWDHPTMWQKITKIFESRHAATAP